MTTAGIVLAAGGSTRFGGPVSKLLVEFRGRPLVSWAIEAARHADLDELFVIIGGVDLEGLVPDDVVQVENPHWAEGMATSLVAGVEAAHDHDHAAVVVGLGDTPLVASAAWTAVAASRAPIAVATYEGKRRNPVRLHRSVWDLLPREGDVGARLLIEERDDLVEEIPCPGVPIDIDTPEDLSRWS